MSTLTGLESRRCVICGAYAREGVLCAEHRNRGESLSLKLRDVTTHERIPLTDLSVDRRYQAPINEARIRQITSQFNVYLLDDLTVSRREDGTQVLLDGQHRWLALLSMNYQDAPCEVFTGLSYEEEALIFAERNLRRRTPHRSILFNAWAEGGIPVFAEAREILARFGYRLGDSSSRGAAASTLRCPGVVERVHAMGLLATTLSIISQAWPQQPNALRGEVVMGLAGFVKLYPEVEVVDLIRSLSRFSVDDLLTRSKAMTRASLERRAWVHFTHAVADTYNFKRSANRVTRKEVPFSAISQWIRAAA